MATAKEQKLTQHKASGSLAIDRINDTLVCSEEALTDPMAHTLFKMQYASLETSYKSFESFHSKIIASVSILDDNEALHDIEKGIKTECDKKYFKIKTIVSKKVFE